MLIALFHNDRRLFNAQWRASSVAAPKSAMTHNTASHELRFKIRLATRFNLMSFDTLRAASGSTKISQKLYATLVFYDRTY